MTSELTSHVDIDATPERVWQVLMDLPAYAEWNPFLSGAEGTFAVGGSPVMRVPAAHPLLRVTLRPTVLEVTPPRRLRLRLRMTRIGLPGMLDAEQTVTLIPRDDGGVRLWHEARFSGVLVPLLTRSLNRDRSPAYLAMNDALKERVEGVQRT
jgi:hypothetical protein